MDDCPCNGCPDRVVGCHSVCPKYPDWKMKQEEKARKKKLEYDLYALTWKDYTKDGNWRLWK